MRLVLLSAVASFLQVSNAVQAAPQAAPSTQAAGQQRDVEFSAMDATGQSASASGTVRVHASREVVWALITSCPEAMGMFPGLTTCNVLETAPDQSWQRIRHVMQYSWYFPSLTYELRASYQKPTHVDIERIAGDLRVLRGSWDLQSDGEYTVAHYQVDLTPGFWVPRWAVHAALKRDLPKMLRSLRARAEAVQLSER